MTLAFDSFWGRFVSNLTAVRGHSWFYVGSDTWWYLGDQIRVGRICEKSFTASTMPPALKILGFFLATADCVLRVIPSCVQGSQLAVLGVSKALPEFKPTSSVALTAHYAAT